MKKKGLCADAKAKVWKIYPKEKVVDLQVSITNKFGTDFKKTLKSSSILPVYLLNLR